jgi:hypothetical protein
MVLAREIKTSLSEAFAHTSSVPASSLACCSCGVSASRPAWVVAAGHATWSRATDIPTRSDGPMDYSLLLIVGVCVLGLLTIR